MRIKSIWKTAVLVLSASIAALALAGVPANAQAAGLSMGLKTSYVFPSGQVKIAYKTKGLKRGSKLVLQRSYGTKQRFRKVQSLKQTGGRFMSVTVTGPPSMGRYWYRVVATRHGRVRAKSPARGLLVLDKVPLERMVDYPVSRTVQVGSNLFRFVWYDTSLWRRGDTVLRMDSTSCRALSIEGIGTHHADAEVWFEMVQETGDPSTTNFRTNQLVQAGMGLTGGAFFLKMGSTGDSVNGYVNGFGLCFTKDGKLPKP